MLKIEDIEDDLSRMYRIAIENSIPKKYVVIVRGNDQYLLLPNMIAEYYDQHHIFDYLSNEDYIYDNTLDFKLEVPMLLYQIGVDIDTINSILSIPIDKDIFENTFNTWLDGLQKELEDDNVKYSNMKSIQEQIINVEPYMISKIDIIRVGYIGYIGVNDGLDIFNRSRTSQQVQMIQYIDVLGKSYYKIYKDKVNVNVLEDNNSIAIEYNHLYLTIWLKDEEYVLVDYDIERGIIKFKLEGVDDSGIRSIIESALDVKISEYRRNSIDANFTIYGIDIIEPIFLDMILNDDVLSTYIIFNESNKPYYEKRNVNIINRLNDIELLSATLYQYYAIGGEKVTIYDPLTTQTSTITLNQDIPYIIVKVNKAVSDKSLNQFVNIFPRLLRIYKNNENSVVDIYKRVLGIDIVSKIEELKGISKYKPSPTSNIYRIRSLAGDLFVSDYARVCQCNAQPIIISVDEVDIWKQKGRQILYFPPPPNNQLILVCPDDKRPYPGVKRNKILSNADKYPYVPCCYKTDQMNIRSNSAYNEYYHNIPQRHGSNIYHKMTTDKVLPLNRIGMLPISIEKLLSRRLKDVVRYGVMVSPNSCIHALCQILDDKYNYTEDYIINVRKDIIESIYPSLLKQELYDISESEISYRLSTDEFFDTQIFYRALEEYFNVNLYVLTYQPISRKEGSRLRDTANIEIPRYKYYPIKLYREDRKVVLLYRHWGAESDGLKYPHYEIIVQYDEVNKTITNIFNADIDMDIDFSGMVYVYGDIFSNVDRNNIVKQYIDDIGKVRAFIYKVNDISYTAIINPTQPENIESTTELVKVDYNDLVKVIDVNKIRSVDRVGIGLWYDDVYIPLKSVDGLDMYEDGELNPLYNTQLTTSYYTNLQRQYKNLEIILNLTLWLYTLSGLSIDEFIDRYVYVGDDDRYDFTNLPIDIPPITNIDEAIEYINRHSEGYIYDSKGIYLYKILDAIRYFIESTINNFDTVKVNKILSNSVNVDDNIVLNSREEFGIWLAMSKKDTINQIYETIDNKMHILIDPYLYDDNGVICLIQNTNDIYRALSIAYVWSIERVNMGYNGEIYDEIKSLPYKLYIVEGGKLKYVNGEGKYRILDYGNKLYAAILGYDS